MGAGWNQCQATLISPSRQVATLFGVSESDILCKQFLTDRDGLVLALRQRYFRPQQGESDDRAEVPGGPPADPMWMQRLDLNADNYITVVPDILYYRGNMNTGC